MSPELSYGRHRGPAPATAQAAAVMLLLFPRDGRWYLPLTQRPTALLRHGGQISLPGGRIERGESPAAAARRELAEELGMCEPCELLGPLPDRYVFASDYIISPFVAAASQEPHWNPHAGEVERIVELPLDVVLEPPPTSHITIHRGPLTFHAPAFHVGDDRIWGVTAIILADLADAVRSAIGTQPTMI